MTDKKRKDTSLYAALDISQGLSFVSQQAFTETEFASFCERNPEWRIELDPTGKLLFMPPVHLDSGRFELEIGAALHHFTKQTGLGQAFGASTGFKLPDGSIRAADAAWISNEQVQKLTAKERKTFARVVPEFVVELRSDSDSLEQLKNKMSGTWIANGVKVAWLIDPIELKAYVYRPDGSIQVVGNFSETLTAEPVLEGFNFYLGLLT